MKKISLVNASPKGQKSTSNYLLKEFSRLLDPEEYEDNFINIISSKDNNTFESLSNSTMIILAFPLYIDCLPAFLIDFLNDYENFLNNRKNLPKVYAIVNMGFPEAEQTKTALNIVENFCKKTNHSYQYGIGIGMGGALGTNPKSRISREPYKPIHNSFLEMINDFDNDIYNTDCIKENKYITPNIPKFIYTFLGSISWLRHGSENGLKRKDLLKKLY